MKAAYDVVTIGAGPAGAAVAYAAAAHGLDVLLVDRARFPRFKVCGSCLNARGLARLRAMGLGDLVPGLGARSLDRLTVRSSSGSAGLPIEGSVAVSRARFDAALAERARRAGATFLDGTTAVAAAAANGTRTVELRDAGGTRDVRAAVVVVADGLAGSALRGVDAVASEVGPGSRIGAGAIVEEAPDDYRPGEIALACGRSGYVGTVRLEDGALDVAAALEPGFVARCGGPGESVVRILAEAGAPAIPALGAVRWRGTPALTRRRRVVGGQRLFVVGDAAGYVEPFTGEGMAWALEGAAVLASLLPSAVERWRPELSREWRRRHERSVRRRQWGCRAVASVLRRPWLTRGAVAVAANTPKLITPLVRHLTQPLGG